jgi:hypothetical protein
MQSATYQEIIKQSGRVTYSASRTTSKKGPDRHFVPVLTLKLPLRKFKRYIKLDKEVSVHERQDHYLCKIWIAHLTSELPTNISKDDVPCICWYLSCKCNLETVVSQISYKIR